MSAAFEHAAATHPELGREAWCRFAGRPVRFRLMGRVLSRRILAPFAHLETQRLGASGLGLIVDIWDEAETGVPCPVSPAPGAWLAWRAAEGTLLASPDGRCVGFHYGDSLTLFDRAEKRIVGWRKSAASFSRYERSKPFIILLSVWYNDRDLQIVHAGLVARKEHGILMPGRGGAGKSTACLLCACDRFDFLGDDFVGLEAVPDGPFLGHSVFDTICLEPHNLARFPELARHFVGSVPPVEDKAILSLSKVFPGQVRSAAPIRTIVLPRIVNRPTSRMVPAAKPQALREFAASTLRNVLPRPGAAAMAKISLLVERVPAYWLELGRDTAGVARLLEELLARTSGA